MLSQGTAAACCCSALWAWALCWSCCRIQRGALRVACIKDEGCLLVLPHALLVSSAALCIWAARRSMHAAGRRSLQRRGAPSRVPCRA